MLKKEGGQITVTGYVRNGNVVLEINDTGTLMERYRHPNATIPASLFIPPT
jgi:sensor histidine kinase YesM